MPQARNPVKAVEVLDLLLDYFGAEGEHWLRGLLGDGQGNRCLVGALRFVRRTHGIKGDGAGYYLAEAMPWPLQPLEVFNDGCEDFAQLREVILQARAGARAALRGAPPERWAA